MHMKKTFLTASLLTASLFMTSNVSAVEYLKYKIEWGDTLSQISMDHNTSIESVVVLNDIKDIDLIYANDVLKIPEDNNEAEQEAIKKSKTNTPTEETNDSNEEVANSDQSTTEKLSSKKSNENILIQSVLDKFDDYEFKY